ncbi:hypothetical protein FOL46_005020 [Perkinsus olseni]|uniref:Uncharacterized protein n=1 Tax=Perkinsus olseni TaxID=32597 RepID=A0A7J6LVN2_PEROL|nr:hypothetical protein FOL46_005020 [Perkinsus olseni]
MASETLVEKEGSCDEAPCVVREDLSIFGWVRICLVGLAIFGTSCSMTLQGVFSIPFAMKMGLPESASSLVWLCGPVTGMIIQPLVGRWSDGHVSRGNGRSRLPFLVVGALILSLCTVVIGYSIELGELLGDRGSSHTVGLVILILIFWVYDAASNVVMVVSRSALVDIAPPRHVPTGFFTQTSISSELGGMCGGWIASQDWSTATGMNLSSKILYAPPTSLPAVLVSTSSQLGGPLNSTLHSDSVSFVIGGVGSLAAAALVLRRRYW